MRLGLQWWFLLICYQFRPSMQDCVQNDNGFSDLPWGSPVVSDPNYSAGSLQTYYDLVVAFIDVVQPVGYQDIVRSLLPTLLGSGSTAAAVKAQENATQILVWNVGVLVMIGVGLVFIVVLFLSCCCFFCCRLCGNCGSNAHKYRSKHQHVKCIVVTVIMALSLSMALSGAVTQLVSNEGISEGIASINNTISSASSDALNYVTNTVEQVKVILDHLDCTFAHILNITNGVSQLAAKLNVTQSFASFFASVEASKNAVGSLSTMIDQLDNTSMVLQQLALNLTDSLSSIAADLDSLKADCTASSACENIPHGSSIKIDNGLNTTNMILNLTELMNNIQEANSTIATISQNAHNTADNISQNIQQWVNSSQVTDAVNTIANAVDSIKDPANKLANTSTGAAQKVDAYLSKGMSQLPNINAVVLTYDVYRYWVFAGLGIAILVVVGFFLLGLLCGLFGFSNKVHPNERNSVSHAGAICLLLTVALSVLVVLILMLTLVLLFILGTPLQKVCETISPPTYPIFSEVMDDTALWGGVTLIGNLTAGALNMPVNISVSQILSNCEQNASLWNAVQGDTILKELSPQFPSAVQNITLDSLQHPDSFIPDLSYTLDEITQTLENALDFNLSSSVNITFLSTLLPFSINSYRFKVLQFNLTSTQANLTNLVMQLQNDQNSSNLTALAIKINNTLTNLSASLIPQVQNKSDELYNMLMQLEAQINATVNATWSTLNQANATIQNLIAQAVSEFESIYNGILADMTMFGKNAASAIQNSLGTCRPVWSVYTAATNAACKGILNGLNGYWFGMGWSIIFLLPTMISAIILTIYLRRSRTKIELGSFEIHENEHVQIRKFEMHNTNEVIEYPLDLPNIPCDEW